MSETAFYLMFFVLVLGLVVFCIFLSRQPALPKDLKDHTELHTLLNKKECTHPFNDLLPAETLEGEVCSYICTHCDEVIYSEMFITGKETRDPDLPSPMLPPEKR